MCTCVVYYFVIIITRIYAKELLLLMLKRSVKNIMEKKHILANFFPPGL